MINELIEKENKTDEEVNFLNLHNKIIYYGTFAGQSIYELGKAIKEINDNKLYLIGGYSNLEEYTEQCFSIKKSQAYNYIKLVENVSLDFFQSTGKIGITKMLLLSDLQNEEMAKEVINNMPDDSSVKDLEKVIKSLKADIKEKEKEIKKIEEEKSILDDKYVQLELRLNDVPEEIKKDIQEKNEQLALKDSKINEQNLRIESLENQVNEISNSNYIKFTIQFADLQKKFKDILGYLDKLEGDLKSDSKKALYSLLKQMENKCN